MAGSLNKVLLIGRLGADPEVKQMVNGKNVARLSLATSNTWKDKNTGEKKEKTEWHRVVIFNEGLVGVVENYVKKGSKLYIEGSLQTRKWTDDSGTEKYTTEVIVQGYGGRIDMLDGKNNNNKDIPEEPKNMSEKSENLKQDSTNQESGKDAKSESLDDLDDEIPF